MLWFSFILGSIFVFSCFVLIIIHYHTQEQKTIKIEPRITLNYDILNAHESDNPKIDESVYIYESEIISSSVNLV